jgi:putative tryptophan/tyrosine transport system permease protein
MSLMIDGLQYIALFVPLILGAYISVGLMQVADLSLEIAYVSGALYSSFVLSHAASLSSGFLFTLLVLVSMIAGIVVGLLSSTITSYMRVSHLLSAIITAGVFHGLNQLITGSYFSISGYPNTLSIVPSLARYPELSMLVCIAGVCIGLFYCMVRTEFGYALATYGNNADFFRYFGISKRYVFIMGIMLANALAGLSGYLFAQSNGFAEMNMGVGRILLCITALVLGKLVLQLRTFSVTIPLCGLVCYVALQQLLLFIGFNLKYFMMAQSLIIVCVLAVTRMSRRVLSRDNLGV